MFDRIKMQRFCSVVWICLALGGLAWPIAAEAQIICISNVTAPPEIPVYAQPPIPAAGYMWTPGYWASGPNGYFWVPGTWVQPPAVGLLWTPGHWAWRDGIYVWSAGYWGPHVGFYGGINYGFGYDGVGYEGGRWVNGVFAYNRAVNNFGSVTMTDVYEKAIAVEPGATRISFNGGSGGTTAQPTLREEAAAHEQHVAAISAQFQHERTASANKALLASENHGRPAIAATAKPSEFTGQGVVAAREEKPATPLPAAKPPGLVPVKPHANSPETLEQKGPEDDSGATLTTGALPKPAKTELKPNIETKPNVEGEPSTETKPPTSTSDKASDTKPDARATTAPKFRPTSQAKPAAKEKGRSDTGGFPWLQNLGRP
jgi:hypothetical protein